MSNPRVDRLKIRKILKRLLILSSKVVLGFLCLALVLILLIHLPVSQKWITTKASQYLSATTHAAITINEISFSLWGEAIVKGLEVRDPEGNLLLASEKIGVIPNLLNIIFGNLDIQFIEVKGIHAQLIKTRDGLNIQFIIDAFTPPERGPPNKKKSFSLQIAQVNLEDIHFEYASEADSLNLDVQLGKFNAFDFGLSTSPNIISLSKIYLEQSDVALLTYKKSTPKESSYLPPLDFGSGFEFDVGIIELRDNDVSFNKNQIKETLYFDPDHLALNSTDIYLKDLLIRDDSLSFNLSHFSTELPGFSLSELKARLQIGQNQLTLSDLKLSSGDSEVQLEVAASYNNWLGLLDDLDQANAAVSMLSSINPDDFHYFLHDTLVAKTEHWPLTELELKGTLSSNSIGLSNLSLTSGNSQLLVNGTLNKVFDPGNRSWENMSINASAGSVFKSLISPYIGRVKLPQELQFQLTSSGNPDSFYLESQLNSSGGSINIKGKAGLQQNSFPVDFLIEGNQVDVGGFVDIPWLGLVNTNLSAVGDISDETGMEVSGQIEKMSIADNEIENIDIQSNLNMKGAALTVQVNDPDYRSAIQSNLLFREPFSINGNLQLNDFSMGHFLPQDTLLLVSGEINSKISIDQSSMEGFLKGLEISLKSQQDNYLIDSLSLGMMISPTISAIDIYSDDMNGVLDSNFDVREISEVVKDLYRNWTLSDSLQHPAKDRNFNFNFEVAATTPLHLFIDEISDFSGLQVSGNFRENDQTLEIEADSHKFNGFGISLDTLHAAFSALPQSINSKLLAENISYNNIYLGDLDFHILDEGDGAYSSLSLFRDTISVIRITSHIQPDNNGMYIFLDSISSFNQEYIIDRNNSIFLEEGNILFDHFLISQNELEIKLNGDLNNFDLDIIGADLKNLNNIIGMDTTMINNGSLYGSISYDKRDDQFNFQAAVDSLVVYNGTSIKMEASAFTEKSSAPIHFSLQGVENNVELDGEYFLDNSEIDAALLLDINDLTMFEFLFPGIFEEMSGKVKGQTRIKGPLQTLIYEGSLRFVDVEVTTSKPRSTFRLKDEVISLDNSGVFLDDFTIYDQRHNPLVLNGALRTKYFQSFDYDLTLDTENYLLLNNPATEEYPIQGTLAVGSNLKLQGNERDTYVDANIIIRDTTELTFVTSQKNLELLTSDGIIEFVDPSEKTDSISISQTQSFYDSLIATLPDFELTSAITLEDQAVFRVIVDAHSGDFIEVSGAADLELGFDRTGNIQLEGSYTITEGFYQLSFYDMVKKKFNISAGSSVKWTGDPTNGELDIKAFQTINTSSIGLIGHEIGENEKAIYRKSLPYEVAIVIAGTIENPEISFTLDLPEDDKISYPALASKLDRLSQSEFESELNKQVFGLLVLGGFIPESSGTDYDQSLIATTALTNSVNSILASQLNRFAGQFIKGVDINIQLQSYSDYTSGGGQTRTAMDFKVTKRMMHDRLSIEVGGGVDINSSQSGQNTGDGFRHDITVLYDLTESGSKQLKMFNNETYDIIYHEVRNTGIALIFIREFDKEDKRPKK